MTRNHLIDAHASLVLDEIRGQFAQAKVDIDGKCNRIIKAAHERARRERMKGRE